MNGKYLPIQSSILPIKQPSVVLKHAQSGFLPPEGTEEIEVACREEFVHTMTELGILMDELYNLGQEQSSSVKQMDADSLCERLI